MKNFNYIILVFICFCSISLKAQVDFETLSNRIVKRSDERYEVRNGVVEINQAVNPIRNGVIYIRNGGGLRFTNGADITFGEVERDAGGNILRDDLGLPIVKSRVMIIEEEDAASFGADNYNNNNARFQSGCNVNFEGVIYYQSTNNRSDFDIRSGANVSFYNSEVIINGTTNYPHFGSSNVVVDGLRIDNRFNEIALEFTSGGIPSTLNNLNLVDNDPGSGTRHLVFINNPDQLYEVDNIRARNVSFYEGSGFTGKFNNPLSNILKSNNNLGGVLEVHRDLEISAVNEDGSAANGVKLYMERKNGTQAFQTTQNLDTQGEHTERLLQYRIPHSSSTQEFNNEYDILLLDYEKSVYYNDFTLDFVPGLNGKNQIQNILLTTDNNTTKTAAQAASISGIAITHNPSNDQGTITISGAVTLCDLYDFVKLDKVNSNELEPTPGELVTQVNGGTLEIGNYQIDLQAGGVLQPCGKFQKIVSNVASSIADPNQNLEVALTDANGTYKLIRLLGLQSADITITDELTSTQLLQSNNVTGTLNFVTQSVSTDLSIAVTRTGYTNWGANLDLNTDDIFNLFVSQAELSGSLGNPATLANQEDIIYLSQKLLQKSEAINSALDNESMPTISVNSANQAATNATLEKQEEVLELLWRILLNTESTNEKLTK